MFELISKMYCDFHRLILTGELYVSVYKVMNSRFCYTIGCKNSLWVVRIQIQHY